MSRPSLRQQAYRRPGVRFFRWISTPHFNLSSRTGPPSPRPRFLGTEAYSTCAMRPVAMIILGVLVNAKDLGNLLPEHHSNFLARDVGAISFVKACYSSGRTPNYPSAQEYALFIINRKVWHLCICRHFTLRDPGKIFPASWNRKEGLSPTGEQFETVCNLGATRHQW